jgi:predicted ferric reductase
MRDFDGQAGREIDFYYTVRSPDEALFLDEIEQAQARQPGFRAHISYSNRDGHLSVEKIVATSGPVAGKEVYLCGPFGMIMALEAQLVKQGWRRKDHYEEFTFR